MKTALITGASGGIGSAIAERLRADGFRVILGYHASAYQARALADKLSGEAVYTDLGTEAGIEEASKIAAERPVDVLINNAGTAQFGLLCDMSETEIRTILRTDLESAILLSRAALPRMIRNGYGRIVNIASIWGVRGSACETVYSAAKAGLIGFTKALAYEVGSCGVTVNAVAPGAIDTRMNSRLSPEEKRAVEESTPIGRFGTPKEVASAVSYLASGEAGFITAETLTVSGGFN